MEAAADDQIIRCGSGAALSPRRLSVGDAGCVEKRRDGVRRPGDHLKI
jgi:hypothetical protein